MLSIYFIEKKIFREGKQQPKTYMLARSLEIQLVCGYRGSSIYVSCGHFRTSWVRASEVANSSNSAQFNKPAKSCK